MPVPSVHTDPEQEHEVTPLELFFDLVFVFGMSQLASSADPSIMAWSCRDTGDAHSYIPGVVSHQLVCHHDPGRSITGSLDDVNSDAVGLVHERFSDKRIHYLRLCICYSLSADSTGTNPLDIFQCAQCRLPRALLPGPYLANSYDPLMGCRCRRPTRMSVCCGGGWLPGSICWAHGWHIPFLGGVSIPRTSVLTQITCWNDVVCSC